MPNNALQLTPGTIDAMYNTRGGYGSDVAGGGFQRGGLYSALDQSRRATQQFEDELAQHKKDENAAAYRALYGTLAGAAAGGLGLALAPASMGLAGTIGSGVSRAISPNAIDTGGLTSALGAHQWLGDSRDKLNQYGRRETQ
jgi:hypothetical protein